MKETIVTIDDPEGLRKGRYATHTRIIGTDNEFILDFVLIEPTVAGQPEGKGFLLGRFIVSVAHLASLQKSLEEQLDSWRKKRGQVPPSDGGTPPMGFN